MLIKEPAKYADTGRNHNLERLATINESMSMGFGLQAGPREVLGLGTYFFQVPTGPVPAPAYKSMIFF